jgi:hypothetical protein
MHPGGGGEVPGCSPAKPPELKFKKHRFCRYYGIKGFTWFPLQPKSATEISWWLVHYNFEKYINKIKKQEDKTLWVCQGMCSYICMTINAVAKSIMLHLQHFSYNIIFKIKQIKYGIRVSPRQGKILGAPLTCGSVSKCWRKCSQKIRSQFQAQQETIGLLIISGLVGHFWTINLLKFHLFTEKKWDEKTA